jgi:U32 family peptidase
MTHTQLDTRQKIPELLAPAGSPEAFRAAVAAGADAVYLSGKKFGARKFAGNFTEEEIGLAIDFAHRRGVRVYVTVNTAIHDAELEDAGEYLIRLYSLGVDAVLVQDTGLATLAREIIPGLTLHASTQMTIHTAEGVRWAAEQGFARVVLARELPLAAVRRIAEETRDLSVGLEVFAHGALCYCYSGQCLFSSFIGGRSGNRGMCAQPCRKPYAFVTGETDPFGRPARLQEHPSPARYLLSPRDLSTYWHLGKLVHSPLASLKIEGRMRSPEYVAVVVSTYRRALDAVTAGTFTPAPAAVHDLMLAFNRGFTGGYLSGERGDRLMGRDAPDNRGVAIGEVAGFDPKTRTVSVKLCGQVIPEAGDGLLVVSPAHECGESGFPLNNAPVPGKKGFVSFSIPAPVKAGSVVFITFSRELDARAKRIIGQPDGTLRHPVPLDITVTVNPDGIMLLEGTVRSARGDEVRVSQAPDLQLTPARSRPLSREQLAEQLGKTGGTPFAIRTLTLNYNGTLFAPLSALNKVRRDFLSLAEEQMAASCRPRPEEVAEAEGRWRQERSRTKGRIIAPEKSSAPPRLCVYADSVNSIRSAVLAGCDTVCHEPGFSSGCGTGREEVNLLIGSEIAEASAICREAGVTYLWKFPRIADDEYLTAILPIAQRLAAAGITRYLVDTTGTARFLVRTLPTAEITGSTGLNLFNHATARALAPVFQLLTVSPELSGDEIRSLVAAARAEGPAPGFALIVQGSGEMMVSEDCLAGMKAEGEKRAGHTTHFTGIGDATGRLFPVFTDSQCRTHILNAAETCLIDHLPAIISAGIDEIVIDARGRTPEYAGTMTKIYREAIGVTTGRTGAVQYELDRLKEEVKRIALGGITAGHFLRGLKE